MRPGPTNTIIDIAGVRVGNAHDETVKTGVTAVLADAPFTASVHVAGGAPGTRETDLLDPSRTVDRIDALILSGGSAFGLQAAGGAQAVLHGMGRGYPVGPARVPIVPAAIVFDLLNGGDKDWGDAPPYEALGRRAVSEASTSPPRLGSSGAGFGATTATLKGGLGSASAVLDDGTMIAALVVVNAVGSAIMGSGPHFWAAPFEIGDEFGGLGLPDDLSEATRLATKGGAPNPAENTTIAVVATDADLTKAEAKHLAVMAHDGFARAVWPAHTPFDGDLVFGMATATRSGPVDPTAMLRIGAAASAVMARAIARGVYLADPHPTDTQPAWSARFGG
ncbi:MAG: P1 family peptidase [Pseudomonadota bacterium]